jgi:hypothetical protein
MVSIRESCLQQCDHDEVVKQREVLSSEEDVDDLRRLIRENFLAHLNAIGLIGSIDNNVQRFDSKEVIRAYHAAHRTEYRMRECKFVEKFGRKLLNNFADGCEIVPNAIEPILCPVASDSYDSALFRLATLLWSVPVSRGYGRRMRFLVRDKSNGKLMGLFALADPVFNLRARDSWIEWNVNDRRQRLVNVMDAFVVGAVPPYTHLLGGKVVASLMSSQEVCDAFAAKYCDSRGIISGEQKHPHLALITVTSALGRSSLYNRLKLPGMVEFLRIGMTEGWGHFQVPEKLFLDMRRLLELEGHPYASGHEFGQGPNWRMRVVRAALIKVGLDPNLMRHGIAREVYAVPLAQNWREFLCGRAKTCDVQRHSATEISRLAVQRWMVPRASRNPEYYNWTRCNTWEALTGASRVPNYP